MTERDLIKKVLVGLGAADRALNDNNHIMYAEQMSACLDLLTRELANSNPDTKIEPVEYFNPEQALDQVAASIKHRTISKTHRWKIVYYYTRICCVPYSEDIPPQIIIGEFTQQMVDTGFTLVYWNQIKTNIIKLQKELSQ